MRIAETAASRPLLVVPDWEEGQLLYNIRVESADSGEPTPELRLYPLPVFPRSVARRRCPALAVSGTTVLGLGHDSQSTVVHDAVTRAVAPGPPLHDYKNRPAMLPVGDDAVLVMDTALRRRGDSCCFELLRLSPGGGWRAFRLPEPPVGELNVPGKAARISAYLALGARVWISVTGKGTFSLDVERGTWRVEGSWELPLDGRAMFVPELGSVIGLNLSLGPFRGERCLCALDVEAGRPPVLRHVWEETYPSECLQAGHVPWGDMVSMAYLGNGTFIICRPVCVERARDGTMTRYAISFMAVQVRCLPGGELQLTKRGQPAYYGEWPQGLWPFPYFIQPS
ncbi:hypothetical protein ACP70R_028494 [Stipagrostis hirtigluma subsp. patula]